MPKHGFHRPLSLYLSLLTLCLFAVSSQAQVEPLWGLMRHHPLGHLQFSPDGRWALYGRGLYRSDTDWFTERVPQQLLNGRAWFVGNNLLLVEEQGKLVLRHLPTLRPLQVLDTLQWSPSVGVVSAVDGSRFVVAKLRTFLTAPEAEVQVWQTKPLRLRFVFAPRLSSSAGLAMSADGTRLAYSSYAPSGEAEEVVVRSTDTGLQVARFAFDTQVYGVDLSPDGQTIAICHGWRWGSQFYVSVYRVVDGALVRRFGPFAAPCVSLVFSRDGNLLAGSAGPDYERWFWALWRLSDGTQIASELEWASVRGETYSVQFSPDGRSLYVLGSDWHRQVDTASGSTVREVPHFRAIAMEFMQGGQQIAVLEPSTMGFQVSLRRVLDGSITQSIALPGVIRWPSFFAMSPEARYIAVVGEDALGNSGLLLYEVVDGNAVLRWSRDGQELLNLRFTSDSQRLFALHRSDASVEVYDTATGDMTVLPLGIVMNYSVSPDGVYLGVAGREEISIWRLSDLTPVYRMPVATNEFDMYHRGVVFSGNGEIAVLWDQFLPDDGIEYRVSICVLHLPTGYVRACYRFTLMGGNVSVSISADGTLLAVSHSSRTTFYRVPASGYSPLFPLFEYPAHSVQFAPYGGLAVLNGETIARIATGEFDVFGRVVMDGWMGPLPEHLRYRVHDGHTGAVLGEGILNLIDVGGTTKAEFVLPVSSLNSVLTVWGAPFLVGRGRYDQGQSVQLYTGDIDGDNEVTLFDFGLLVQAFGTFAGDDAWNIDADLDGDGEITLMDFAWLVNHFGMIGDE